VFGFSESREVGGCLLALQFFHEEATQAGAHRVSDGSKQESAVDDLGGQQRG